jgi:Predicted metal-sulfur cluster biosynthetic enzyme
MNLNKNIVKKQLVQVLDPELGISIVDLGLIYKIEIKKNKVKIVMTLTTIGCPLFSLIEQEIKNKLIELGLKEEDIVLELTFEPPWSVERMSKKAKAMLGI